MSPDRLEPGRPPPRLPPARSIGLVALGGAVGAVTRVAQTAAFPTPPGGMPWATLAENLVGAFLLCGLLTVLTGRLPGNTWARPLLGTGLLGAYTTFATVGLELFNLAVAGRPTYLATYLALTWIGGLTAGAAGIAVGGALARRTR